MMEIHWYAVVLAAAAHYAIGVLWFSPILFGGVSQHSGSGSFHLRLLVGAAAVTIGTTAIVLTLAHVSLSEALLATGGLGLCYAVIAPFGSPAMTRSIQSAAIGGGYCLLGIILVTIILYQWG